MRAGILLIIVGAVVILGPLASLPIGTAGTGIASPSSTNEIRMRRLCPLSPTARVTGVRPGSRGAPDCPTACIPSRK